MIKLNVTLSIFSRKIFPMSLTIVVSAFTPVAGEHPYSIRKFICSLEIKVFPLASASCSFLSLDLTSISITLSFKYYSKFFFIAILNFANILLFAKNRIASTSPFDRPFVCLSFMKISRQHAYIQKWYVCL